MSSSIPLRRSNRIATLKTKKFLAEASAAGKSEFLIVKELLKSVESTQIMAEKAAAVLTVMEYLLEHQTLWQTNQRFQQSTLNKANEFINSPPPNENIAYMLHKIKEVSKKLSEAIINFRLLNGSKQA